LTISLFEQVRQVVSDIFAVPVQKIGADSSPNTIEAWDSIQHLNLVLALEEKFNLQLSPEEMQQMRSVGQISAMLESKLHRTPS
jgi:acyl carrier protein